MKNENILVVKKREDMMQNVTHYKTT